MISESSQTFFFVFLNVVASLLIIALAVLLVSVVVMYFVDITQTSHAIRRNFPVMGRFRYVFEHLGEFFRQYFFAMDREELPFNRAQRAWVYRAAKDLNNTVAFGSTRDLRAPGTVLFANCPYPALETEETAAESLVIGPGAVKPFVPKSFFNISGMSYGALSAPAVRALSKGARLAGCWMNTGEGGLSPYHLEGECDLVVQIGTAKYGVRDLAGTLSEDRLRELAAHDQVRMFEIKLSQGAKPGKGGILPGGKVTEEIARIRGIAVGQDSISPNRHTDVSNNGELLELIGRVRRLTGKPTGLKTVLGAAGWLDELFAEINRRGAESAPDFITVDGAEGGSGAAPMPLIDAVGLPIREALPLLVDKLIKHGLRDRIRVIASGKLVNPTDVAWALCVGADFTVSARGFMFALGCIQSLRCNQNTCPTGITTHNQRLQRGLDPDDKAQRVAHYHHNMIHEVSVLAHSCGARSPRELNRTHARIVQANGLSIPLNELYPPSRAPLTPGGGAVAP